MIRNSFIFLEGVSVKTEYNLWNAGIKNWSDFVGTNKIKGISAKRKSYYDLALKQANRALFDYDSSFFTSCLNNSEVWRLYDYFRDDCLFIDIETAYRRGNISVIGLYNGYEVKSLIRNVNLEKQILKKYFDNCKLLVSFNGLSYDIPIIRKFFGNIIPNIPHLDLRHTLAKIGFCNGLKKIEKDLNIKRDESVKKLFGKDAAQLWKLFNFHEDDFFFEKLLKYNEEDVVNLKQLSEFVFKKLKTAYSNFLL